MVSGVSIAEYTKEKQLTKPKQTKKNLEQRLLPLQGNLVFLCSLKEAVSYEDAV